MSMMKRLGQTGDTIVEVLISLAVIGMAFGIAFATANKSLITARNSEEHSQALQYADGQLELLRSAATNDDASTTTGIFGQAGGAFCLGVSSAPVHVVPFINWVPINNGPENDDFSKYPAECVDNTYYHLSVVYCPNGSQLNSDICATGPGNQDEFKVLVRWDGVSTLGRQQELITFRLHP